MLTLADWLGFMYLLSFGLRMFVVLRFPSGRLPWQQLGPGPGHADEQQPPIFRGIGCGDGSGSGQAQRQQAISQPARNTTSNSGPCEPDGADADA